MSKEQQFGWLKFVGVFLAISGTGAALVKNDVEQSRDILSANQGITRTINAVQDHEQRLRAVELIAPELQSMRRTLDRIETKLDNTPTNKP